jgi:hypothetical protein
MFISHNVCAWFKCHFLLWSSPLIFTPAGPRISKTPQVQTSNILTSKFVVFPCKLRNSAIPFRIWEVSVNIVTSLKAERYRNCISIPDKITDYFSSPKCPHRFQRPQRFLFSGCWNYCSGKEVSPSKAESGDWIMPQLPHTPSWRGKLLADEFRAHSYWLELKIVTVFVPVALHGDEFGFPPCRKHIVKSGCTEGAEKNIWTRYRVTRN